MKQNVLQMFYRIAKFGISNCIEHAKMPVTIGKKHFCRFNEQGYSYHRELLSENHIEYRLNYSVLLMPFLKVRGRD